MITLVAKGVVYFSQGDEDSFFKWLKRIRAVKSIRGIGRELEIEVDENTCTDANLRELIALFHRYAVEMKPLQQLLTSKNAHWFRDDKVKYWHDAVFGE